MDATRHSATLVAGATAPARDARLATVAITAAPFAIASIGLVTTYLGHRAWYSDEDGSASSGSILRRASPR